MDCGAQLAGSQIGRVNVMPGKVNVRGNVQGANCPGVEMSGRIVTPLPSQ